MKLGMFLSAIGYLIFILGGFAVGAIFFYGIYALFAIKWSYGLMLIGSSVVGTFLVRFISGLLMVAGSKIGARAIEKQIDE
jgi:hypothetical protein